VWDLPEAGVANGELSTSIFTTPLTFRQDLWAVIYRPPNVYV
jgi:hypothetical protein